MFKMMPLLSHKASRFDPDFAVGTEVFFDLTSEWQAKLLIRVIHLTHARLITQRAGFILAKATESSLLNTV